MTELPLTGALDQGLAAGCDLDDGASVPAAGRRDELLALARVHDLHLAPLSRLGDRAARQHDPAVAALKGRLEARLVARLDRYAAEDGDPGTLAAVATELVPDARVAHEYEAPSAVHVVPNVCRLPIR